MQVFGHGVQLVSKGEVEPRDTREKAAKGLRMVRRSQSSLGIIALEPGIEAEVEQRRDSPVLVMHDGVTESILLFLSKRVH